MFREGWEGGDCILTEGDSASVCRGYHQLHRPHRQSSSSGRLFTHHTQRLRCGVFFFILVSFLVDSLFVKMCVHESHIHVSGFICLLFHEDPIR